MINNEDFGDDLYEESKVANNFILGMVIGILVPLIAVIFFNYSVNKELTLTEFYFSMQEKGIMSGILSLTGIPNLMLFFVFMKLNKLKTVKGIMAATLLLAIIVFVVKFSI
jgi:hypothetical protein